MGKYLEVRKRLIAAEKLLRGKTTTQLPPLRFTVNSTNDLIQLQAYGMGFDFQLASGGSDVLFNGASLLGKRTEINLGSKAKHEVVLKCTPEVIKKPLRS